MRKLSGKEFLRFNISRFNIYYAGAFLVAAGIVALILSSEPVKSDHGTYEHSIINNSKEKSFVKDEKKVIQEFDAKDGKTNKLIENKNSQGPDIVSAEEPSKSIQSRTNIIVVTTDVNGSSNKKGLYFETKSKKNELQGGFKTDSAFFETSAREGCSPLKIHFYNKSEPSDSCYWTFGDGGYSDEKNPEWIFDVEGEYNVILNVYGSEGRHATYSTNIRVYPKPLARFEIASDKGGLQDDEIRIINFSTNALHFKWNFGDGSTSETFEPRHRYAKSGNYNLRLVASSDYGCSDTTAVMNAVSGSEYFIKFPNAFIPDNQGPSGGYYSYTSDENAKVFHPESYGVSDYQLKIFSKLSILIFESKDINIGWDGYIKGQLSTPGVYIWKVRGTFRNGESFIKMGDVTLLKN